MKRWFYGIKGIEFIWRGTQSDPLVAYKGHRFNYWDFEDAMYYDFLEENPGGTEDEFRAWMAENEEHAKCYLDDWIFSL